MVSGAMPIVIEVHQRGRRGRHAFKDLVIAAACATWTSPRLLLHDMSLSERRKQR